MTKKEELVNKLTEISEDNYYPVTLEVIADFIIKEREIVTLSAKIEALSDFRNGTFSREILTKKLDYLLNELNSYGIYL